MSSSQASRWLAAIQEACAEPNPAKSNERITGLHFALSEELARKLGRDAGPNFHTWAVWGSRKAGVTIRQEDLGSAIRNATVTAGIIGTAVGLAAGVMAGRKLGWHSTAANATLGLLLGISTGAWSGRELAVWSRSRAAALILKGNQVVLQDIGSQTARFLDMLETGATPESRRLFFDGLRPGSTEQGGQERLAAAFRYYLEAWDNTDVAIRREAMIQGNCAIVYHEHIRLEPFIRGAMPWIIRRCATERLMTYEVGSRTLTVGEGVPGARKPTAAHDWTVLEQRMRYVFALFRHFHDEPEAFARPLP